MSKISQKKEKCPKNEEGIALITAIFSILLATLIGFALYYSSTIALTIALNDRDNNEAFYIADAGFNHAYALLKKVPQSQFSDVLKAGANITPGSGDELSVPPSSGLWATSESIPAGSATGGGVTNFGAGGVGRYWVSVKNDTATGETSTTDTNGILIVTSTGVGRDGSNAIIEAAISMSSSNMPAVLINGNFNISGTMILRGSQGAVHANGTLDFDGNPCATQYFSSSANVVDPSNSRGTGCSASGVNRSNQPIIPPPLYNIRTDFYNKADYILGASGAQAGKVFNKFGTLLHNTSTQGSDWILNGSKWSWDLGGKRWIHGGDTIVNGTYYSEGNMEVGDSYGTGSAPARVTLIAEGYISVSGNPYMRPSYQNFSMVAGTDLRISGNPGAGQTNFEGIHYAHHQIQFSGNPSINGIVIAANQADTNSPGCGCNFIPLESNGFMKVSGNPTITYNGGLLGGGGSTTISSWREIRR